MKRGDVWLIAVLLLAVGLFMIPKWFGAAADNGTKLAKITVDGEPYQTVPLTKNVQEIEIRTDRGYNKLMIYDDGIEMAEADCPDKVCVHTGFRQHVGETIVCLPHRVVVEVIGDGNDGTEIDAVAS